jgi:hypothetical protein
MATNAEKLNELAISIAQLVTDLSGVKIQTSAMYKILVTGNGNKPLPEIVRNHEEWIECYKLEMKADRTARKEFTWKVALEVAKQFLYPLGIGIAIWLGLR